MKLQHDDLDRPGARSSLDKNPAEFLIRSLMRHRWWIVLMTLLGLVGAAVVAAIIPNTYLSTAKVLIRHGERETQTVDTLDDDRKGPAGAVNLGTMVNYLHILRDPGLYMQVAMKVDTERLFQRIEPDAFDSESTPAPVRLWHDFQIWCRERIPFKGPAEVPTGGDRRYLAEYLLARTLVENPMRSNIFAISFEAFDPGVAQEVTRLILKTFVERQMELYNPNVSWLENETQAARQKVEELKKALHDYKAKCGIYNYEEYQTTLVESVTRLQDSLELLRAGHTAAAKELAKRLEELPSVPELIETLEPRPLIDNPRYASLQAEISDFRRRLVEERRRDRIARLEAQIEERQEKLAKIPPMLEPDPIVQKVPNPERDRTLERIQELHEEVDFKAIEIENLQAQLDKRSQELHFLESCKPELDETEQELSRWQREHGRLSRNLASALLTAKLSRDKESNFLEIQKASYPLSKRNPNRLAIVGGGVAAGLFLGVFVALLCGFLGGRRIRDPKDVRRVFTAPPVLAILEPPAGRSRQLRQGASDR